MDLKRKGRYLCRTLGFDQVEVRQPEGLMVIHRVTKRILRCLLAPTLQWWSSVRKPKPKLCIERAASIRLS